jgi:hypothetical protein
MQGTKSSAYRQKLFEDSTMLEIATDMNSMNFGKAIQNLKSPTTRV